MSEKTSGTTTDYASSEALYLGAILRAAQTQDGADQIPAMFKAVEDADILDCRNRTIRLAIRELADNGTIPDVANVAEWLIVNAAEQQAGGLAYVQQLHDDQAFWMGWKTHATIIHESGRRLRMDKALFDARKILDDPDIEDPFAAAAAVVQSASLNGKAMRRSESIRVDQIIRRPLCWLWPDKFPLGKISVLAGDPGLGKSTVTLDIAARVSKGAGWPVDGGITEPAGVVLLSAEDDADDTIAPRLDAAGADGRNIRILTTALSRGKRMPVCLADLAPLREAVADTPECKLVIIDPVSSYLGKTDSHNNAEVRGILAPLGEMAAELGICVLLVSHLTKGSTVGTVQKAIYRISGSLAFTGAPRAVWGVIECPDTPKEDFRRLVLPIKTNLSRGAAGLAYRTEIIRAGQMATVVWEPDPVVINADDAMTVAKTNPGPAPEKRNGAADWLRANLAGRPRAVISVLSDAKAAEIAESTIRRAAKDLGVISFKPEPGPQFWKLP